MQFSHTGKKVGVKKTASDPLFCVQQSTRVRDMPGAGALCKELQDWLATASKHLTHQTMPSNVKLIESRLPP
jgi:hypothetical protein